MKILLLAPMVPQEDGAGAIPVLLYAQIAGLREHHEVTLVTAVGDEPGEAEAAARLAGSGLEIHVADRRQPSSALRRWRRRWRMARTWARGRWPWRAVWFADPGIQTILDRLMERQEFDLVVVEDSAMAVFRLPPKVPAVLTEHEVLRPRGIDWRAGPPTDWPGWALRELDWRRRPRFQRWAWRRFSLVLVFSDRDAEVVAEVAPRVRVSPFGLTLPPAPDPDREVAGTVLFVGNFTHQPNRDAAVWLAREIMPEVQSRCPEAKLQIVGSNPPREVLELESPRVDVVADAPSIAPHMETASIVIAPVRTGGGMRMKVLNALASGKAVVTTARGAEGFLNFTSDPPFIIADGRGEIAAAAAALLQDDARRRELGARARAFVEQHYSPSAWASRLEDIYEEACAMQPTGKEVSRE